MPFSPAEIEAAAAIQSDMDKLNEHLAAAGRIADRLTQRGYDVTMTLWHDTMGSHTVKGRLQANVSKAFLRTAPKRG